MPLLHADKKYIYYLNQEPRNAFLETGAIFEVYVNTVQINTHKASQSFGLFDQMVECSFTN